MATYIKTLKDINEDVILPKTSSTAVLMADGTTSLETKLSTVISAVDTITEDPINAIAAEIQILDSAANYTATNVEDALIEIANNFAAISADAIDINLTDTSGYYTSDNVEGALQELGLDATTNVKDTDIGVTVQEQLVNQTNIKSINGESILGSGDLDTLTSKTLTTPTISGLMTLNGGQIKFPATQNPSADANTLDDYEEGTWTPLLTFGSGTAVLGTYNCNYIKVGKMVTIIAYINVSSVSSPNYGIYLYGMPFIIRKGARFKVIPNVMASATNLVAEMLIDNYGIYIINTNEATDSYAGSAIKAGTHLPVMFQYLTD